MISVRYENALARCTFDIGKVNAFGRADIHELEEIIESLNRDFPEKIRAVSFESQKLSPKGLPIFCAGADQKERAGWSSEEILSHVAWQRSVIHQLRLSPLHVICCVDGYALGLGTEICLASDSVIATPKAVFGFPEKSWGLVPGAGGYAWAHGWAPHPEDAQFYIDRETRLDSEHAQWLGIVDILAEDTSDFELQIDYLMGFILYESPEEQMAHKKKYHEKIDYKLLFEQEQAAYAKCIHLMRNA